MTLLIALFLSPCLLTGAVVKGAPPPHGDVYNVTIEPGAEDSFDIAHFRIWFPPAANTLRGVYAYLNPHLSDSRGIAYDDDFRALCQSRDFVLLGAQLDSSHMDSGIGEAVLAALTAFAEMTGHSELAHTTIFFDGWSWGGQFAYHFTLWRPDRVIAFVTQKGGYHDTGPAANAVLVPGYLFIGEYDLPYRIENLTGIFEQHRPLGARWILAMQPGAGHGRITDRVLLDDYFVTMADRRLPVEIPPDQPVELRILPADECWLGNRATSAIGAYACYDAAVDSACWLATRSIGTAWQAFVSDGTVCDTIPCDPVVNVPGDHRNSGAPPSALVGQLQAFPNPFNPTTTLTYELSRGAAVKLTVFDAAGRRLVGLIDGWQAAGEQRVVWNGRTAVGRPVASGIYYCQLRAEGVTRVARLLLAR